MTVTLSVSLTVALPLDRWEEELEARPEADAKSNAGRTATAAFQQAKRHMRPFFKLLKAREMPLDVLSTMVEITSFMQKREYVKANDAYIRCAIGTAPWPMGITGLAPPPPLAEAAPEPAPATKLKPATKAAARRAAPWPRRISGSVCYLALPWQRAGCRSDC